MSTSVKMREQDKRRLDKLQGRLMAKGGRKVSQQKLMAWLLGLGEARADEFPDDPARAMNDREIAAMHRLIVKTGIPTSEEDIDRVLYGADE